MIATQKRLSAFMAQSLDWGLWIGLLLIVTALGLAARSAGPQTPSLQIQADPYGTGVSAGSANGSGETHSRVEAGS
jgi:hypothetical protein